MRSVRDRIADETELVQTYLAPLAAPGALGLNDDAAIIQIEPGCDLVVSTDPILAGVHFFPDDVPHDIAWKALAVNVSDLIAKGAQPIAYTMTLALPDAPLRSWMADFSAGLKEAQAAFGCGLIGGDTDRTAGPLAIGVSAFGAVPRDRFIKRNTARIGDHVFITGPVGDAALGLALRRNPKAFPEIASEAHRKALLRRYFRPAPPLAAITMLRTYATAALDVSDGLVQDASRLARGADAALAIPVAVLPVSPAAEPLLKASPDSIDILLTGGDDYEVLFAVAPNLVTDMRAAAAVIRQPIHELGVLSAGSGVSVLHSNGEPLVMRAGGYDHFRRM